MIAHYETLTQLWHDTVWAMWRGKMTDPLDYVSGTDTHCYDNMLVSESMAYDFDMRDLWLNKQRWTVLVRQYLDISEVARFLDRATALGLGEGKRGAVTSMAVKNVRREPKKHRWGPCMASFTFRGVRSGDPRPTLTLHSRVSYIAYIGGLDLALAHVIAREIARRIEMDVADFRFVWHVDSLQFHCFKSLPLLYRQEYIEDLNDDRLRRKYPTIRIVGRWWDTILIAEDNGKTLEEEKYGPLRRVRRRYQEYCRGDFVPSVPVERLTLEVLR